MRRIIEGVKKLYMGPNKAETQTMLVVFSVFTMLLGLNPSLPNSLIVIAAAIYIGGWQFKFLHNAFEDEFELPRLDASMFSVFFKAFPLIIVWTVYAMIVGLVLLAVAIAATSIFPGLASGPGLFSLAAVLGIVLLLYMVFAFFIFIAYSKDYSKDGLWNMLLPIKFMEKYFVKTVVLTLIMLAITVSCYLAASLLTKFALGNGFVIGEYLLEFLSGYIAIVVGYGYDYCLVQIYKEGQGLEITN